VRKTGTCVEQAAMTGNPANSSESASEGGDEDFDMGVALRSAFITDRRENVEDEATSTWL